MTEYERKWLSFIEETKATDTGILNEYVSDIINTAKTIAARSQGARHLTLATIGIRAGKC